MDLGTERFGSVRKMEVMRFVSESLPRLIHGADGSDPLPQMLLLFNYSVAWTASILAVFRTLLT